MNTDSIATIGNVADQLEAWAEAETRAVSDLWKDADRSDRLQHQNRANNYASCAKRLRAALAGRPCYCGFGITGPCDYCAGLRTVSA